MKKFAKISVVILLMIFSFGLGALVAARNHFGTPIITFELENLSSQKIASAMIENKNGSVVVKNLDSNSSRHVRIYAPGESSYRLDVTFEDGHVVSDDAEYVESGYYIQAKINENSIQTNTSMHGYEP